MELPRLLIAAPGGDVFEVDEFAMAGRSGSRYRLPDLDELVPLPEGSTLFTLPQQTPVGWRNGAFETVNFGDGYHAVSAFVSAGYTRTLLPASERLPGAPVLPLWAYTAVGWKENRFWVSAIMTDSDPRGRPESYYDESHNDENLVGLVEARIGDEPSNRLLHQLGRCALEYHCFAAKNVFYRRWECPLPTAPTCNAACLGCISLQAAQCCPASQERISFVPRVSEILSITVPHLLTAERPIISFGQGCEGEPLLEVDTLVAAINGMRKETSRGTINVNTNGYSGDRLARLADAGLDSVRISLNSARQEPYMRYYRPSNYNFLDVVSAIRTAKKRNLFVSLNLLILPGFSDRKKEIDALIQLYEIAPYDMIQLRNLNMDPDFYLGQAADGDEAGIGISGMKKTLADSIPELRFGYYNPLLDNSG